MGTWQKFWEKCKQIYGWFSRRQIALHASSAGFFLWSQLFSSVTTDTAVITPMVYLYMQTFGSGNTVTERNAGLGAAIGILLAIFVVIVFWVCNNLFKNDDLEL